MSRNVYDRLNQKPLELIQGLNHLVPLQSSVPPMGLSANKLLAFLETI